VLLTGDDFKYFSDQSGKAYLRFFTGQCFEIQPLNSTAFQTFVKRLAFEVFGLPIKDQVMKEAFGVLTGTATYEGEKHKLDHRSVRKGNEIWIDLGNQAREAVSPDRLSLGVCLHD